MAGYRCLDSVHAHIIRSFLRLSWVQWVSRVGYINQLIEHTTGAEMKRDAFEIVIMREPGLCTHEDMIPGQQMIKSKRPPISVAVRADQRHFQRIAHRTLEPQEPSLKNACVRVHELHADFQHAACELINSATHRYQHVANTAAATFQQNMVPLCGSLTEAVIPNLLQKACMMHHVQSQENFLLEGDEISREIEKICLVREIMNAVILIIVVPTPIATDTCSISESPFVGHT